MNIYERIMKAHRLPKPVGGINVLSLFDGMSCGQIALNRAGIKVNKYYASEIDKPAITVTQHNYPNTIQLGDVTKWREWDIDWSNIDLLIGGSPCFIGSERVLTLDGLKFISQVKVGDKVLTHNLNWKPVITTGCKVSETLKVRAYGIPETVTTPNHPYLVRHRNKVWDNTVRRYVYHFGKPEWKRASSLNKGDYLVVPIVKDTDNCYNLTDDECFILGRYIADGHTRKDLRNEKSRNATRHWQLILSIGKGKEFATNVKHSMYSHTQNTYRMVFSSKRLVCIAEKECGCGAINKHIGTGLLRLPKSKLRKLIEGYMSGDGSRRGNENRLTTISKGLAISLQLALAKAYGIVASCNQYTVKDKKTIQGRIVNQHTVQYQLSWRDAGTLKHHYITQDDHILVPFKGNDKSAVATVYNLEVADDNSYTLNGVHVHNCQGFSFAGKQLNFDDHRSKLFFVFVDILNHIKQHNPNVKFLLENVRMKQEYENTITDILGVCPVFINSSLVSAQNRPRLYWANWKITPPKDKGIILKDILEQETFGTAVSSTEHSHVERKQGNGWVSVGGDKSQCLTVCGVTHWQGTYIPIAEMDDGRCCVRGALRTPNTCIQVSVVPDLAYEKVARVYSSEGKSPTITKHCDHAEDIPKLATSNSTYRRLTPVECERLQTVPDNYTSIVAQTKRHAMLGNGWTVDVIVHIFSCLWNLD